MTVYINGEASTLKPDDTLKDLIDARFDKKSGLAVAIDCCVVPKQNWENTKLQDNQRIIIIKATQGG